MILNLFTLNIAFDRANESIKNVYFFVRLITPGTDVYLSVFRLHSICALCFKMLSVFYRQKISIRAFFTCSSICSLYTG